MALGRVLIYFERNVYILMIGPAASVVQGVCDESSVRSLLENAVPLLCAYGCPTKGGGGWVGASSGENNQSPTACVFFIQHLCAIIWLPMCQFGYQKCPT